jgi:endonuclease YncB( thermonuclease family)
MDIRRLRTRLAAHGRRALSHARFAGVILVAVSEQQLMRLPLGVALLLAAATSALAAKPGPPVDGRVVKITDGDTLTVLDGSNVQHKIRLAGIDAPEKGQPFGTKARENLAGKVFGQAVHVEVIDVDRYHREVGRIYLGERFINAEMVRDGFAWRYPQYDKPGEFTAAENDAREHRRGLWADPNPMPPWEWRKTKRQSRRSK